MQWKPFIIVAKLTIVDVYRGLGYTSDFTDMPPASYASRLSSFFHAIADYSKMSYDRQIELYGILEAVATISNKHWYQ